MDIDNWIVLVHGRQEIYSSCYPKHRKRDFIAGVWKEIATQLNANGKLFYSMQ
jgi:hypothetical protein